MRIRAGFYPQDYVNELQIAGKRLKARCFMEYWHDLQMDAVNSFGFYAVSWGSKEKAMSKGTVHKWVGEFVDEIERFHNAGSLKNRAHYSSVKKQSERQVNGKETKNTAKEPKKSTPKKEQRTESERQVNEDINMIDDDTRARRMSKRLAEDLYTIYRFNSKYAGERSKAVDAYLEIDKDIKHKDMVIAVFLYLHDPDVERKVGMAKFIENEIYLNYMDMSIAVLIDGEWIYGVYDSSSEVFRSTDGTEWRLTPARLAEKFSDDELRFEVESVA